MLVHQWYRLLSLASQRGNADKVLCSFSFNFSDKEPEEVLCTIEAC